MDRHILKKLHCSEIISHTNLNMGEIIQIFSYICVGHFL